MSNTQHAPRRTARRIIVSSAIAAAALAASILPATGALAQGGPVNATIAIPSTLTFTFTSATSFTVAPGATDMGAVAFTVATNDGAGYTISQSAPDLSNGSGGTLPAGDLSYVLHATNAGGAGQPGRRPR